MQASPFVASGLCDEGQPGRNGSAPWTLHDAFYITSFGCGRSERGNHTVGRDANEGWSYRNGRVSALSFRVWRQCGVPGCFLPQAQVKCSPRRDTVLGVVPWAITGRCPLCGAPAELEFDDMNVDGQPPGVLLNMWLAPMPAARFVRLNVPGWL